MAAEDTKAALVARLFVFGHQKSEAMPLFSQSP
jgi:hypothetical protein